MIPRFLVVALIAMVAISASAADIGRVETARSFVSSGYVMNIDGVSTPIFSKSASGGAITAETIEEPMGPDRMIHKHLGPIIYEPMTIQIGLSEPKGLCQWIIDSLGPNPPRQDVTITEVDLNMQPKTQRKLLRSLISEITIPACDAASRDPACLTMVIAPESIQQAQPQAAPSCAVQPETLAPKQFPPPD